MLNILNAMDPASSPDEVCARLGEALGLEAPVPAPVMRRALVDETFALHLVMARGHASSLRLLFSDPRNRKYEDGAEAAAPEDAVPSSLELMWKAGKAVARWGADGFGRVEPEVFEARFGACQGCEYLKAPPDRFVYKVKLGTRSDQRVCSACGCVAARKAALPTERCPVAHQEDPTLNRWGEPLRRRQE